MLISPVLGRILFLPDLWIELGIARFFAHRGFAAAIVQRDFFAYDPTQGIEQVGRYMAGEVARARRVLDEVLEHPAVDPDRAVSLGISFGGLIHVLLAAEEPRLKAHVFALAGGSVAEILATSRDPLVSFYRRQILHGLKMKAKDFTERLGMELQEDPLKVAGLIEKERVLMITARLDRVVCSKCSSNLWEALGKPECLYVPVGHYFSIFLLPYLERKALEFFKRKLYNATAHEPR